MKLYLHKAAQLEPEAIEVSPNTSVAEVVAGAGGGALYVLREDQDRLERVGRPPGRHPRSLTSSTSSPAAAFGWRWA